MSESSVKGFPKKWPVRDDNRKSWRYMIVGWGLRMVFNVLFAPRLLRIEGAENLPSEGPLLIVANHQSDIDPLLFGAYVRSSIYAMGKREIFELFPGAPWLIGGCNSFPVDRGGADRWALKTAFKLLEDRRRLLVFLEGTRAPKPGMQQAQKGVGMMLRASDAAVLPCAIIGTERVLGRGMKRLHRAPVIIRYGKPIAGLAATSRDVQELADRCAAEIAVLLPEEYRGIYSEAAAALEATARGERPVAVDGAETTTASIAPD